MFIIFRKVKQFSFVSDKDEAFLLSNNQSFLDFHDRIVLYKLSVFKAILFDNCDMDGTNFTVWTYMHFLINKKLMYKSRYS